MDEVRASRRAGGAVHRGMVWLLRHEPRWLVDLLIALRFLPAGEYAIEVLPTEAWPVGEENRAREIRADVVLRLWPGRVPEGPSLALIRASHVIGLILDFQDHPDPTKGQRLREYDSAYPPILGSRIHLVLLTMRDAIARAMTKAFARQRPSMKTLVLTPRQIPRRAPIDAHQAPRRALLEAMIHVRGETQLPLLVAALRALDEFEGNELLIYQEMLMSEMQAELIMQAHQELDYPDDDADIDFDYRLTKRERRSFLFVRGAQEGRARAILDVFRARGLAVDPPSEARVLACVDDEQLSAWLARAITVARVDELFEPG